MDCGPTCLRMVAKFYNRNISIQKLRDQTHVGKEGVSLLGVSEAAESIGFRTHSAKLPYSTLVSDAKLPAILHWRQNHFVVLYKVKAGKLHIADPARGLVKLTEEEFKSNWISDKQDGAEEGIVLLLEPSPLFYQQDDDGVLKTEKVSDFFKYLSPYKKLITQLFIGLAVASLIQLILPFLTQSVVDTGVNNSNIHFVYIILLAQLALFAGRIAVEFVRGWILLHISTRVNIAILTDFLIKLMKLPVSYFDSKHTGDIMQRMDDHKRIESFLTGSSISILFSIINLVVFSFVLAFFNAGIFIVFAVASILYGFWIAFFMKKRRELDYKTFNIASRQQATTIQLVHGMQEIKLNGVEKQSRWAWEGLQAKLFKLRVRALSLNQWQQAGGFFINEGKNIFITFLAAKAVIDNEMTLGTMLAVQYIIGQLNSPIEQMIGFMQNWQSAKISIERLNEIHKLDDEEPSDKFLSQELPSSFTKGIVGGRKDQHSSLTDISENYSTTIQARSEDLNDASINLINICFTYPGAGNEPVLKDINLNIPKGKTTAIVGVSGSGKTTLLKLLLKFYEPTKGDIRLGQISLKNLSHRVWRQNCGVVMQESFIFSDSIAYNIAVGAERPDMDRLRHAASVACIDDFIETLPLRYNTKIGMEGSGISMGQRQRILIARAVYRNPDFILFDEATNSLDANNESQILKNLETFLEGRTVIVVAHRLSTVKNADQIIVLNKGGITEKGTHQELVSLKGEYFALVKNQLELDY